MNCIMDINFSWGVNYLIFLWFNMFKMLMIISINMFINLINIDLMCLFSVFCNFVKMFLKYLFVFWFFKMIGLVLIRYL